MTDIEARSRFLLDLARSGHDPSSADAARVRARLHARALAAPLLLAPKAASALGATGKGALFKLALALGAGASAGAAIAAGAMLVTPAAPATTLEPAPPPTTALPRTSPTRQPAAPAAVQPSLAEPSLAEPTPPPPHPSQLPHAGAASSAAQPVPSAAATEEPAAPATPDLRREIASLRLAEQALHAGRPAQALTVASELDRAVGAGSMAEERMAIRAIALCSLGRRTSPELDSFWQRYSGSVHAARVRAACSDAPAKSETEPAPSEHP